MAMPTGRACRHSVPSAMRGPTGEWRMAQVGSRPVPVAAIQRFHLADADGR